VNSTVFKYLSIVTFAVAITCICCSSLVQASTLTVKFKNLKTAEFPIYINLIKFDNLKTQTWETIKPELIKKIEPEQLNKATTLQDLKPGNYIIRAFQDTNKNTLLDKTSSLIPTEPVAFSQNPSLFKGEPTLEETSFAIDADTTITLKFKHRKKRKKKKRY